MLIKRRKVADAQVGRFLCDFFRAMLHFSGIKGPFVNAGKRRKRTCFSGKKKSGEMLPSFEVGKKFEFGLRKRVFSRVIGL